ncbi:MAG: transcription antitermination factor NusB [Clostridia bacterium]
MSRKSARENAFKIIYNSALLKEPPHDMCQYFEETCKDELWAEDSMSKNDKEYMKMVVFGACEKKNEINEKIAPLLKKWDIARIPKVSLAILQLAIYEIDNVEDVPEKVAANEAVELAKKYGDEDTYKFINGVLAEYLKNAQNN